MERDKREKTVDAMGKAKTRVVIENVSPEVDAGRFPIKRVEGEQVIVEADIFADGHDSLSCVLLYRRAEHTQWREAVMTFLVNDRWRGSFGVAEPGRYIYSVKAWVDRFATWRRDLKKKVEASQDVSTDLLLGAELLERAATRASGAHGILLKERAEVLKSGMASKEQMALDRELVDLMALYQDRTHAVTYDRDLEVIVDRERARFSSWYEMFPRSCAGSPSAHGTLQDGAARLAYVAEMGFDVLYLPPLHPIGHTHRKGRNNTPQAGPRDPGSPWAIGSEMGGHKAIHPRLGTLEDFQALMVRAREYGMEIALDMAFQCSPDHPYAREHPEWFNHLPDGSIRYAENPPKKYEDIYPLNFETDRCQELWAELKEVALYWIAQGVRIFRVDNPHTKPFSFWEWLIKGIKRDYPDVIFLAEAFTRPKVMYRLAKLGFTQSYTYFAWRNTGPEIAEYFEELAQTGVGEYFRPNLWPNTPDILTEYLQTGGRPGFMIRLVLAATLGANYGIYGPAFELCEDRAKEFGREEYLNSEKYEIKDWKIDTPDSLKEFIARVNRIRRQNPALQRDRGLRFHATDREQLLCYSKQTEDLSNIILVVVNLDPHHTQGGWVTLPLKEMGLDARQPYQVHDLLGNGRYLWHGAQNYLEINPGVVPAHIYRIRRRVRTEKDFDYFM